MFFGLTGNIKQSRASLRDALAEVNRTKPEDQLAVANALATLAANANNGHLAAEIVAATKHLRPSAVDLHVIDALMSCPSDTMIARSLEKMALACIQADDAAGLSLIAQAQKRHDAKVQAESRRVREVAAQAKVSADIAARVAARKRQRAADHRRAEPLSLR